MALVSMAKMLKEARKQGYAVGYFEPWDLESLKSIINAAEEEHSPVIIGFNAGGGKWEKLIDADNLNYYAAMLRVAAEKTTVPTALLLNEITGFQQVIQGIQRGFTAIMIDKAELPLKENTNLVKKIVEIAHSVDISIEAQVGVVPSEEEIAGKAKETFMTNPEEAAQFVRETEVDALSVSIGNIHRLKQGKAEVNLNRLKEINALIDTPLVMHGGSGFPDNSIKNVIELGVAKFNIATELRIAFFEGVKKTLAKEEKVEHPLEILRSAKLEIKNLVKSKMRLYGSAKKCNN